MGGEIVLIQARDLGQWHGCYDSGWQGEIVPEAFTHPAKFSRALIRRIYEHAFSEGWLAPGMTVADPFGGVALGALDALWNGLTWIGVELEPRFVTLGQQNLDLWQHKYGEKAGFGSARILQGDSRQLVSVIQSAEIVIASPPYSDSVNAKSHGIDWTKAGPSTGNRKRGDGSKHEETLRAHLAYGNMEGQLSSMKEGEAPRIDCVVASPPYASKRLHDHSIDPMKFAEPERAGGNCQATTMKDYGDTEGQLSAMPEGKFDAVVGSPPFEKGAEGHLGSHKFKDAEAFADHMLLQDSKNPRIHARSKQALMRSYERDKNKSYGNSDGQLGGDSGDTFWQAASEIVAQCHAILKPGGHAIWVCKDFVRKGKRVPFSDQWQALCESQGFTLVCRHRAMLVAHHGEQETIFGQTERITTERKSFFRRLAEKKGSPRIDWEDVICLGVR